MVYKNPPKDFKPKFEVVSCYFECEGEILLLHRNKNKIHCGMWGVPAGKVDSGEDVVTAMVREAFEETGVKIQLLELKYLEKVFVRHADADFVYHMFKIEFKTKPDVVLSSKEHTDFLWVAPQKAHTIPLIQDLDECIKMYY